DVPERPIRFHAEPRIADAAGVFFWLLTVREKSLAGETIALILAWRSGRGVGRVQLGVCFTTPKVCRMRTTLVDDGLLKMLEGCNASIPGAGPSKGSRAGTADVLRCKVLELTFVASVRTAPPRRIDAPGEARLA